jgi:methionyl-tRNA formyltransferase
VKRPVVFLGTPEAAVTVLESLVAHHDVELVVTQPDKKRGRGGALIPSPIKSAALAHGISVAHDLDVLKSLSDDPNRVAVVVAYGRIIPTDILMLQPTINIHFSLLPRWRGAAPVERAIMAGDVETGVCIMEVEPTLDTGGVYASRSTVISDSDNAATLTTRLAQIGADLLLEVLESDLGEPVAQSGEATYAHKIDSTERFISWQDTSTDIWRRTRAMSCFAILGGKRIGVKEVLDLPSRSGSCASITPEGVVFARYGAVQLVTVQPEGKGAMPATDWIRGLHGVGDFRFAEEMQ